MKKAVFTIKIEKGKTLIGKINADIDLKIPDYLCPQEKAALIAAVDHLGTEVRNRFGLKVRGTKQW